MKRGAWRVVRGENNDRGPAVAGKLRRGKRERLRLKTERTCKVRRIEGERVQLCTDARAIEIMGMTLRPDQSRAYVEFYMAHAFPVIVSDQTSLHPQVVANSYLSLLHKVFDLNHMMRAYSPEEKRDWILGSVVGVEFPGGADLNASETGLPGQGALPGGPAEAGTPYGGGANGIWRVQGDRDKAPGIRGAAVMHKQAEKVPDIIALQLEKKIRWMVSMENLYFIPESGLAVLGRNGVEAFEESTPADFRGLGWTYVPLEGLMGKDGDRGDSVPTRELLGCLTEGEDGQLKVKSFRKQETVAMLGGLNGEIHFRGVGLTPAGKEEEARVSRMLASRASGSPSLALPSKVQGLKSKVGEPAEAGTPCGGDLNKVMGALRKGLKIINESQ